MNARRKRWAWIVLVVALVFAAPIGVPLIRTSILRAAGWALVVNDPIEPVDIVVISIDSDGSGVLEATDLVKSGVATRVAVFAGRPDAVSSEFLRRGIPYEDGAARSVRQLNELGLEAVEMIPKSVRGTTEEGPVVADWLHRQGLRSVLIVSTSDHSRRLRRVLHRSLRDPQTKVIVRSSRYTHFDPDRWWKSRNGIRTEIEEGEKLLLDVVLHPIS